MKTYLSMFFAHLNGFVSLGGTVIFMELYAFVDNTLGPQVIDVLKYALANTGIAVLCNESRNIYFPQF